MFESGIDRRELLKTGAVLSAATLAAPAWAAGASSILPLERFIADRRFAPAIASARAAADAGLPVTSFAGDLSALWYDVLDLAWRKRPMTLAGVTAPDGLFVLETLANDRGMRVVYRGTHIVSEGRPAYELLGPRRVIGPLAEVFDRRGFSADALVAALAAYPSGRTSVESVRSAQEPIPASHPGMNEAVGSVVSWVIAPRGVASPIT